MSRLRRLLGRRPGTPAAGPGGPRVVLYGRAGCHLCDQARDVVLAVAARTGADVEEVDVDTADDDGVLAARYGELVPVVVVDGVQHAALRVDAAELEAALR